MASHVNDDGHTAPYCRLLVIKATERCNLNCTYCYMFNGGDKSYLEKPALMSADVVEAVMRRVRNHCRSHEIADFTFVLHGGEPLVAPHKFYKHFASTAKQVLGDEIAVKFALQTNGTLLTNEWCELFRELNIGISFSLDGVRANNDRFRVDRKGRGSFDRTIEGWELAVSKGLRPGLLMVINAESDPLETYELVKKLNPATVDFLLPDATHVKRPPALPANNSLATPYADWLLAIFNAWTAERGAGLKIRLFMQIMRSAMGIKNEGYDVLGTGSVHVLVIESDGEIQPLDGLRFCGDGMASTPFNVKTNELDDAYTFPLIRKYHDSHDDLCETCQQCRIRDVCGGGFLPHRYDSDGTFDHPSVYCRDMTKLIDTVSEWFTFQLSNEKRRAVVSAPN
jgi:uncharacterized protein